VSTEPGAAHIRWPNGKVLGRTLDGLKLDFPRGEDGFGTACGTTFKGEAFPHQTAVELLSWDQMRADNELTFKRAAPPPNLQEDTDQPDQTTFISLRAVNRSPDIFLHSLRAQMSGMSEEEYYGVLKDEIF
jgi:hypothetical protein